jgi:hypothetical protein
MRRILFLIAPLVLLGCSRPAATGCCASAARQRRSRDTGPAASRSIASDPLFAAVAPTPSRRR